MQKKFYDLSDKEFKEIFGSSESCLEYLVKSKWGNSYEKYFCIKCNNKTFHTIRKKPFSLKCGSCDHIESPTANGFFHNTRIAIKVAFYIVYLVIKDNKITGAELSDRTSIRLNTCLDYKKRILNDMKSK